MTLIEKFLRKRVTCRSSLREVYEKSVGENEYFCNNSGKVRSIELIFELDRDIDETELRRKFHHDLTLPSKVIVYTDGRTDGHTDRF